ncbi:hypothetical protein V6L76_20310 [Pannonibacter sp. Pt2]|uniref:Uncharacterized protein n=1 Tax=Pannonibacter anstelovis TaxID=3121537 RepID=A0ABU7ZTU4_9HYPH
MSTGSPTFWFAMRGFGTKSNANRRNERLTELDRRMSEFLMEKQVSGGSELLPHVAAEQARIRTALTEEKA